MTKSEKRRIVTKPGPEFLHIRRSIKYVWKPLDLVGLTPAKGKQWAEAGWLQNGLTTRIKRSSQVEVAARDRPGVPIWYCCGGGYDRALAKHIGQIVNGRDDVGWEEIEKKIDPKYLTDKKPSLSICKTGMCASRDVMVLAYEAALKPLDEHTPIESNDAPADAASPTDCMNINFDFIDSDDEEDKAEVEELVYRTVRQQARGPVRARNLPRLKAESMKVNDGHVCCRRCGQWQDVATGAQKPDFLFEVDHIKARSLGGTDRYENLQLLCLDCHKKKTVLEDVPAIRLSTRAVL